MNAIHPLTRSAILIVGVLSMALGLTGIGQASQASLRYRLEAQAEYVAGQPVTLVFTLENVSSAPLRVLTWHTPLEGLLGRILEVTCDGEDIPYLGPMVKRGSPTQEDYTLLKPGETISVEFDLSRAYSLPLADECRVTFRGTIHDVVLGKAELPREGDARRSMEIPGNAVVFRVSQP